MRSNPIIWRPSRPSSPANAAALKAALLGVCWGLGHTLTLVLVGACSCPARGDAGVGLGRVRVIVALMLVGLGVRAIICGRAGADGPTHMHHHGHVVHTPRGRPAHVHIGRGRSRGVRCWSARFTASREAARSPRWCSRRCLDDGAADVHGAVWIGSTLGMAALSGVLGWPLATPGHESGTSCAASRARRLHVDGARRLLGLSASAFERCCCWKCLCSILRRYRT